MPPFGVAFSLLLGLVFAEVLIYKNLCAFLILEGMLEYRNGQFFGANAMVFLQRSEEYKIKKWT